MGKPITDHPAYIAGTRATNYSDNPYSENTEAFDLFERGFTQKLKRLPDSAINRFFDNRPAPTAAKKKPLRSYSEAKGGY